MPDVLIPVDDLREMAHDDLVNRLRQLTRLTLFAIEGLRVTVEDGKEITTDDIQLVESIAWSADMLAWWLYARQTTEAEPVVPSADPAPDANVRQLRPERGGA